MCYWMTWPTQFADGTRKEFMESLTTVPLLIIDDFGMRKLPLTAAEDLLGDRHAPLRAHQYAVDIEPTRRRLGKLLSDVAAVSAMLDRMLHHGHVRQVRSTELAHEGFSSYVGKRPMRSQSPDKF